MMPSDALESTASPATTRVAPSWSSIATHPEEVELRQYLVQATGPSSSSATQPEASSSTRLTTPRPTMLHWMLQSRMGAEQAVHRLQLRTHRETLHLLRPALVIGSASSQVTRQPAEEPFENR